MNLGNILPLFCPDSTLHGVVFDIFVQALPCTYFISAWASARNAWREASRE
jgi:hypothetical protein